MTMTSIWIMGLLLGVKHSLEPDHVIAVSNMVTESNGFKKASLLGAVWGLGHTLTLLLIGSILLILKFEIPESMSGILEAMVGLMLVYFGVRTLINKDKHTHNRDSRTTYMRSLFMGIVHGVSGSGSLVLLTLMTVNNLLEAIGFILIFGLGTTFSMTLTTATIGVPFSLSKNSKQLNKTLSIITGLISVIFGFYYIYSNIIS